MSRKLRKTIQLNNEEIDELKNLVECCRINDSCLTKMYWNVICDRRNKVCSDYLFLENQSLVAYLGIFIFKTNLAEITALVHPDFRRQGIFKRLLKSLFRQLQQWKIENCLFSCERKASVAQNIIKKYGAVLEHSEYVLEYQNGFKTEVEINPQLEFRFADKTHLKILIDMGVECFKSDYNSVKDRFTSTISQKNRLVWLVYLDGKPIGKIHVNFHSEYAFLHDICVLPDYQNKHYGSSIVQYVVNYLLLNKHKKMSMDVVCNNVGALKVYRRCGFEVVNSYDYLIIKTSNLNIG